jgi:hypothetical protein
MRGVIMNERVVDAQQLRAMFVARAEERVRDALEAVEAFRGVQLHFEELYGATHERAVVARHICEACTARLDGERHALAWLKGEVSR